MKIFDTGRIQQWDVCTMKEQGILSIELMERAANACFEWLLKNELTRQPVKIFCGKGNNGGDGLALARIMANNEITATVYILETGKAGTADFQENLQRLHRVSNEIHFIQAGIPLPELRDGDLVIDALFGSGLNKPLEGLSKELVAHINRSNSPVISIDLPSGLFADKSTMGHMAISATHTLSFQNYKLAFLFPENELYTGHLHLLDIGLSSHYENGEPSAYELLDQEIISSIIRPRSRFSHKGNFGHAALVAGSYGMMGAAVLASRSCLGAGTGKLTVHIPSCGYHIMQTAVPEAMCKTSGEKSVEPGDDLSLYDAVGIGPGIGLQKASGKLLEQVCKNPPASLLLDADALNCLAADKDLQALIPPGTIITPHPKEFERIFGKTANDFERLQLAITKAASLHIYIVLKGHHTAVITPHGKIYFNNTGNAGMAKAGMGDILSGIITGLMAQHYPLPEAALLGVYLHGLAGDIAMEAYSGEAMQSTQLIDCLGYAWKSLAS